MRRLFACLPLLLLLASAHAEAPFDFDRAGGELPKNVVPLHYDLTLRPDLTALTFHGRVTVRIRVRHRTGEIVLNALNLTIVSAELSAPGRARTALAPRLDESRQQLLLALPQPLDPGEYLLSIAYDGVINPQTEGLYYDRYRTAGGERLLLGTQLETADARRLLPCWDEPAFRATFQVSAELPAALQAYSNTPVESRERLPGGSMRTRFARTPKMSSYLLVLVAGELERLATRAGAVEHGVVTTAGRKAAGAYALDASRRLLKFYDGYFGVNYPLPKLDHFAVPSTGGFGAMENWGGILYNEAYLLYDPKRSSPSTRRDVFETLAHEMAHQWFGDLVTMGWWDNLWLNEGFASWMGTKATGALNPDWGMWLRAHADRERALQLDARGSTHPIQQRVRSVSEANDAFDTISYLKGQSFLRMLEHWLGEEPFRDGLRAYMKAHAYSNATTADLWAALERTSGQPVARMASGWTEQPGFPVVRIQASCREGRRTLTLSQQAFRVDGEAPRTRWVIPLTLENGEGTQQVLLDDARRRVEAGRCAAPLVADPEGVGYFRVEYDEDLFAALVRRLPMAPAVRLKLLSDSWALAGVGRQPLAGWLAVLDAMRGETQPAVWNEVLTRLAKLDSLAEGEASQAALRQWAIARLHPQLERLGWQARAREPQPVQELRAQLIRDLGRYGDAAVVAGAQRHFARFLRDRRALDGSIADAVIEVAGIHADEATYGQLQRLLKQARDAEEKARYLNALCAVRDEALAGRSLALALDPDLAPALAASVPKRVAGHGGHVRLAWSFAQQHADALMRIAVAFERNRFFGDILTGRVDRHVSDERAGGADEALVEELQAFAREHLPPEAQAQTRRAVDALRYNARLKQRLLPQLQAVAGVSS